jgi:hypothetical protein
MEDGTTVPLLYILAAHKFGAFDPKEKMPYWGDKMCTNESLDNVELLPMNPDRRPRQNSYGVPSGTPEYLKRYRAANKDKMKTYHQRYYRKMREVYEAALHAAPSTTPILDSQFSKLMEIIPKPPEEE